MVGPGGRIASFSFDTNDKCTKCGDYDKVDCWNHDKKMYECPNKCLDNGTLKKFLFRACQKHTRYCVVNDDAPTLTDELSVLTNAAESLIPETGLFF